MSKAVQKMVVLIRGPSGSGKTMHAEKLRSWAEGVGFDFARMSADDFFEKDVFVDSHEQFRTEYVYEPERRPEAHQVCLGRYIDALTRMGKDRSAVVVVDNTFCEQWEMDNYVKLAEAFGWGFRVVEMVVETVNDVTLCAGRNIHQVPFEVVARHASRFEPWPGAERIRVVKGGPR